MTTIANMRYTLENFNQIIFNGFNYNLDPEIVETISKLSLQVGSPDYVKTPVFVKRDNTNKTGQGQLNSFKETNVTTSSSASISSHKKRRGNKNMEVFDDDWTTVKNFQTTKIEQKTGLDADIDGIRILLNKMTDKNYNETSTKIIELVDKISMEDNDDNMMRVGIIIFDIASTTRFYSRIYSDLYSELINRYDIMKNVFEISFDKFMELFDVIEYVDSKVDYDKFCNINKNNEKRKALSAFFVNLMSKHIISGDKIISIIRSLLNNIMEYINQDDKKNEVDEITENIAILYNREYINQSDYVYEPIDGMNIDEVIEFLARSRVKDFKSLTNKTVFKFMDMIEM
jgi:hypothetical protein